MLALGFNEIDQKIIELGLIEDLGVTFYDATTELLLRDYQGEAKAEIILKQPESMILSGLPLINPILDSFQEPYEIKTVYQDGDKVPGSAVVCEIITSGKVLLMAERVMLNVLRHLSAIATLTHDFVEAVQSTKAKILDTRKTLPGWRHLEKYAVRCGGGVNHRLGLYDAIMVKDTHVDLLGGMAHALAKLPRNSDLPVVVEVRDLAELTMVLTQASEKVDRVLLDNMSLEMLRDAVLLCRDKIPTEASGGVNLSTVRAIAETGVNFISVGMLTHSAGQVDLSMKTEYGYVAK